MAKRQVEPLRNQSSSKTRVPKMLPKEPEVPFGKGLKLVDIHLYTPSQVRQQQSSRLLSISKHQRIPSIASSRNWLKPRKVRWLPQSLIIVDRNLHCYRKHQLKLQLELIDLWAVPLCFCRIGAIEHWSAHPRWQRSMLKDSRAVTCSATKHSTDLLLRVQVGYCNSQQETPYGHLKNQLLSTDRKHQHQ